MHIQPLLRLVAAQPHLLLNHLEAYAALVGEEAGTASAALQRRVLLNAASLVLLTVGAILSGAALMLWAVVSTPPGGMSWVLLAVPAVPIAAALACLALRTPAAPAFSNLREQIAADLQMLRDAS